jgi:hypothetical protein
MTTDELKAIFKSQIDSNEQMVHYMIEGDLEIGPGSIKKTATIYGIAPDQLDNLIEILDGLIYYTDNPYPGFTQYNHPDFNSAEIVSMIPSDDTLPTLPGVTPIPDNVDTREFVKNITESL